MPAHYREWQNTSAYFNGDVVRIQLYVGGNDVRVFLKIEEVIVGEIPRKCNTLQSMRPNRMTASRQVTPPQVVF